MTDFNQLWFVTKSIGSKQNVVWSHHPVVGIIKIADCSSNVTSVSSQRLNARLIANAPPMLELLRDMAGYMEPDHLLAFTDIVKSIGNEQDQGAE